MKKSNWSLIVVSFVVCLFIAIFLFLWIKSQYQFEKSRLSATVKKDLALASDKVTEKMMLNLLKLPEVLNHSNGTNNVQFKSVHAVSTNKGAKSSINSTVRIIVKRSDSSNKLLDTFKKINGKNYQIIQTNNQINQLELHSEKRHNSGNNAEITGLFSKGLKVFVNELAEAKTSGNITQITQQKLDTNLFKKELKKEWSIPDLKYNLIFGTKKVKLGELIFSASNVFNQKVNLMIMNEKEVLIKAILPQLLFAILVFVILILSFYWFYKSWSKQVQLNQMRLDFIHNMSHELKTPVSTVKIALEALNKYEQRNDPQIMNEYLGVMEHEMNRLDQLIERVLSSNTSKETTWKLELETINVSEFLLKKVEHLKTLSDWSSVSFDTVKVKQQFQLYVDPFHLEGVLQNLCDNALKYVGADVKIALGLEEKEQWIVLSIEDNGNGIPTAYQKSIFDAFVRIPSEKNTHNVKGYGLGLNYCKHVLSLHGGTIKYVGAEQGGARFLLYFPKNK